LNLSAQKGSENSDKKSDFKKTIDNLAFIFKIILRTSIDICLLRKDCDKAEFKVLEN